MKRFGSTSWDPLVSPRPFFISNVRLLFSNGGLVPCASSVCDFVLNFLIRVQFLMRSCIWQKHAFHVFIDAETTPDTRPRVILVIGGTTSIPAVVNLRCIMEYRCVYSFVGRRSTTAETTAAAAHLGVTTHMLFLIVVPWSYPELF